jgi:hypothetical protein
MLTVAMWIVGTMVALVTIVVIVGASLPKEHRASATRVVHGAPDAVWALIDDLAAAPAWRSDLKSVERLPDKSGFPAWVEIDRRGHRIPYETVRRDPPRTLVRRIADPALPFGGTWTINVSHTNGHASVEIVEDGEVYNPIFRFMSKFIFGHTKTMESYLDALARRFV